MARHPSFREKSTFSKGRLSLNFLYFTLGLMAYEFLWRPQGFPNMDAIFLYGALAFLPFFLGLSKRLWVALLSLPLAYFLFAALWEGPLTLAYLGAWIFALASGRRARKSPRRPFSPYSWEVGLVSLVNKVIPVLEFLGKLVPSLVPEPRQVYGTPGAHVATGKFASTTGAAGAQGEVRVGEALNALAAEFPAMRVFHGVRFVPGRDGADIDHVVLLGSRVYFIDAKWWKPGAYSWAPPVWDSHGQVAYPLLREGAPFQGNIVHMDGAMERWREVLPRVTFGSFITLAMPVAYTTDNRACPQGVRVEPLAAVELFLRQEAAQAGAVPAKHVEAFRRELQS